MTFKNTDNFDHKQAPKLGVLLVNLGTPEAPTRAAVKPYLKEFLSDPRVVEVPRAIWGLILNGLILPFRSKKSAQAYASIWTDAGSPLLVNTKDICAKLKHRWQATGVEVDFAMRYGQPDIDSKISGLMAKGVTRLLVLPLYPQYSATTTAAVFDAVAASFKRRRWFPELRFLNQYHDDSGYIKALANKVRQHWQTYGQAEKLVLSYHGIPKMFWQKGDPYVCQCFKTSRLLTEELGISEDKLLVCFQSRFGRLEWVQPYLDETLKQLPSQGVTSVQVICPGFSADCLETLEEIAEENRDYFLDAGGKRFEYIPCLNSDDEQIDLLSNLIEQHTSGWQSEDNSDLTATLAEQRKQNK